MALELNNLERVDMPLKQRKKETIKIESKLSKKETKWGMESWSCLQLYICLLYRKLMERLAKLLEILFKASGVLISRAK